MSFITCVLSVCSLHANCSELHVIYVLGCGPRSSQPRTVSVCITQQQLFSEFQEHDSVQLNVSDGNAHVPSLLACLMLTAEKPLLFWSQQLVFDMCQCACPKCLTCSRFKNAVYL